jgi:hypothetical protein
MGRNKRKKNSEKKNPLWMGVDYINVYNLSILRE